MKSKLSKSLLLVMLLLTRSSLVFAEVLPNIGITVGGEQAGASTTVQIILLLTILTLAPSILIMMSSFTRIVIILSFVRKALALQTTPPNQVIVGLALFLTFFVMSPVFTNIYQDAYLPLAANEITEEEALTAAMEPIRNFMFKQVRTEDLALFVELEADTEVTDLESVSNTALIPAFIISELKTAFIIGFMLFIPFIVIDMIVASTLMALGMMMLPPVMISMPFKILLFIMLDGWNLLVKAILAGFN